MNEEIRYDWSEEVGRSGMTAALAATQYRPTLIFFAGIALLVVSLPAWYFSRDFELLFTSVSGLFFICMALQARRVVRRTAREVAAIRDGVQIRVRLTDEELVIFSDRDVNSIAWRKVTRLREKNGFLLFYVGKLLLACLPKQPFNDDQIDFIRLRVNAGAEAVG